MLSLPEESEVKYHFAQTMIGDTGSRSSRGKSSELVGYGPAYSVALFLEQPARISSPAARARLLGLRRKDAGLNFFLRLLSFINLSRMQ